MHVQAFQKIHGTNTSLIFRILYRWESSQVPKFRIEETGATSEWLTLILLTDIIDSCLSMPMIKNSVLLSFHLNYSFLIYARTLRLFLITAAALLFFFRGIKRHIVPYRPHKCVVGPLSPRLRLNFLDTDPSTEACCVLPTRFLTYTHISSTHTHHFLYIWQLYFCYAGDIS